MKKIALALAIVFVIVPLLSAEEKPRAPNDPWRLVPDGQNQMGTGDLYKHQPGSQDSDAQTGTDGYENHGDQQAQERSISRSEENKVDRRRSPWRKLPPYFPRRGR